VSWIPGWGSVAGAAWWSGFYFWASIGGLIALGIAEIASHRYSDRKDELAVVEQEAIQRRHDEEMARVQHDTAQTIERAAKLEKEATEARAAIAAADARAAEANQKAAEARLALEQFKTPRWIIDERSFVDRLKQFQGVSVDVWLIHAPSADAAPLAGRLLVLLKSAQWTANGVFNLMGGMSGAGIMVATRITPSANDQAAAYALIDELGLLGLAGRLDTIDRQSRRHSWGIHWPPRLESARQSLGYCRKQAVDRRQPVTPVSP
jgi:hypothetical protein